MTYITVDVDVDDKDEAEDVAYALYNQGEEAIDEDVVYGDEFVHDITEVESNHG